MATIIAFGENVRLEGLVNDILRIGGPVHMSDIQSAQPVAAFHRQVETGEKVIVGVNEFSSDDDHPVEILKVSNDAEGQQRQRLARLRATRGGTIPRYRRRSWAAISAISARC